MGRRRDPRQCRRHIRGFLEPCLLLLLHLSDGYGYDLTSALGSFGLGNVDSSLVYRMLRDLEEAGLVESAWESATSMGPARRFYRITSAGESHLADWIDDLRVTDETLHYFLEVYDRHISMSERELQMEELGLCEGAVGLCSECAEPDWHAEIVANKRGGKAGMRVVVSANGHDLDAAASPTFGRCAVYVFVDTDTMAFEALDNPAANAGGGAGIRAAQFVIENEAQAVLTGNVGPNAYQVFEAANFPVYMIAGGTVRDAVEAYKAGNLRQAGGASVREHAGMRAGRLGQLPSQPPAVAVTEQRADKAKELTELGQIAADLRRQLAEVMTRIEKLEE